MTWHKSLVVQLECDRCGQVVQVAYDTTPHAVADQHEHDNPGHDVWSAHTVGTPLDVRK